MNPEIKFVTTILVPDPDLKGDVEVAIYKDLQSGGLFGIDASYVDQVLEIGDTVQTPFGTTVTVTEEW